MKPHKSYFHLSFVLSFCYISCQLFLTFIICKLFSILFMFLILFVHCLKELDLCPRSLVKFILPLNVFNLTFKH